MANFVVLIEKYGLGHAVAALRNGALINFLADPLSDEYCSMIGSIMTAKLDSPLKGVNGSFVTLPGNKKGFLKGSCKLPVDSLVPVYISTNAGLNKSQPVSEQLFFRGRYVILTPSKPGINISRKIKNKVLRTKIFSSLSQVKEILPERCGIIVRSKATDDDISDLIKEVKEKINQYLFVIKKKFVEPTVIIPPLKARELAMIDWSFERPYSIIEEDFCFDRFGVWEQLSSFLQSRVDLSNGGYLFIETTSAFVAVDVNTGSDSTYQAALKTNLIAMTELPRQLEIRGLGGKVVVEFAPLLKKDRIKIEGQLKGSIRESHSQCILIGWTKLGNLELQKKRNKITLQNILKKDERFNPQHA